MANGPGLWPHDRIPHLVPGAASSLVPLSTVPDPILATMVEYQGNPATLEFFQPSTSDDFKYDRLSSYPRLELIRAAWQLKNMCTQRTLLHTT